MAQQLILTEARAKLLKQGEYANTTDDGSDLRPVVKFFTPDGSGTWLISELLPDGDTMFGLCDLGDGCPELGYVSLSELQSVRGKMGLRVERDAHFKATKTIVEYADAARQAGRIVT